MRKVLYILGQLNDSDAGWLARHGRRRQLADGEEIVHEGRAIDALFITLGGRFRVTLRDGQEIGRLRVGEVVGEISFVDMSLPTATVAAMGEAVVLAMPKSALQEHLAEDDGFAARFYRALAISLADRLREATRQLEDNEAGDPHSADELDIGVLDTFSQAGQRFTRLLRTLVEQSGATPVSAKLASPSASRAC
jgi:CRP/FNR family transcriptional regulator, cyclic AMP receptor protein